MRSSDEKVPDWRRLPSPYGWDELQEHTTQPHRVFELREVQ